MLLSIDIDQLHHILNWLEHQLFFKSAQKVPTLCNHCAFRLQNVFFKRWIHGKAQDEDDDVDDDEEEEGDDHDDDEDNEDDEDEDDD